MTEDRRVSQGTSSFSHDVRHRLVLPPAGVPPASLIVGLHGMGQSGAQLHETIAPLCRDDRAVLLPDGPLPFEVKNEEGRREGHAWYVYTGDQADFLASAGRTERWLLRLVDDTVAAHGVPAERVVLLGYSQGGYLAGIAALHHPTRFAALVSACSRLKTEVLGDLRVDRSPFPTLALHGERDRFLALDAVEAAADDLRDRGFDVDFRSFASGHRMTAEQVEVTDRWLREVAGI